VRERGRTIAPRHRARAAYYQLGIAYPNSAALEAAQQFDRVSFLKGDSE
jgi:hypothetical protein